MFDLSQFNEYREDNRREVKKAPEVYVPERNRC